MPRISVIIPSYNHERFVGKAISSVLEQTYQDFEIVVTDDGSTDGTVTEIRKFTDPRIRLFTFEKNRGACAATNNCIREANGEYIAVLSSDDIFLPHKLEIQVKFLDDHPEFGAVFGHLQPIDDQGDVITDVNTFNYPYLNRANRTRHEWLRFFFFQGNGLCHPTVLIRKQCYQDVGTYDEKYAQSPDYDLWIRLCMRYEIHVLQETLIRYLVRSDGQNASGDRPEVRVRTAWELTHILEDYLKIDNIDEFLKIFPEATEFGDNLEGDLIPYYLAQIALRVKYAPYQLFAMNTLYRLLGTEHMRKKLNKRHGFDFIDFIKLSGGSDSLNFLELANRDELIQAQSEKLKKGGLSLASVDIEMTKKDDQKQQQDEELRSLRDQLNHLREQLAAKQSESCHMTEHLQELQEQKMRDDAQFRELAALWTQKDTQLQDLQRQKTQDNSTIRELEALVAQKDTQLQDLQRQKVQGDSTIRELEAARPDNQSGRRSALHIFELDQEVARLKAIEDSYSWQTLRRLLRFYDRRLMPPHSKRARLVTSLVQRIRSHRSSSTARTVDPEQRKMPSGNESAAVPTHNESAFAQRSRGSKPKRHYKLPKQLPVFSIVSILYRKEKEVTYFLETLLRQTYPGTFEVILVDDCSPDNSARTVNEYMEKAKASGRHSVIPKVTVLKNDRNIGNCGSRNLGIEHATGDIIVVIDADCMINRDFLKAHAEAYSFGDCDVAVGPLNIETNGKDPFEVIASYELAPELADAQAALQDPINRCSFLNCITRNFSIRKEFIEGPLFDPAFSYSQRRDAGFGWEDVEMGYNLYKRGARIKYLPDSFSIHVTHPSSTDEKTKALRSLLNYRRLFEKHPELLFIARRWALDTYEKICKWLDKSDMPGNKDKEFLDKMFQRFIPNPFCVRANGGRKLRILTYRWHCPHQYELYKLPHEFTLLKGIAPGFTNEWEYRQRPMPHNALFRHYDEVDVGDFDIAILHFDENVLSFENTNGIIGPEWGENFKWFMKNLNIPKVAICHGTPQFYGQYSSECSETDLMQTIEGTRKKLVNFLGDTLVIVNSYQAQREWGFEKSKVIWQGFDPMEFPVTTFERGILTLGKAMKERPHYRGYHLFREIFERFPNQFMPHSYLVPDPHESYEKNSNAYAYAKYRNYIDNIRQYSIYFNPTLRSPMPRARGEAMMCGLVTVSANNHDVDMFIKNGSNGFYSNDPDELREYLLYLLQNPDACRKIGIKGRKTAMDIFNHDKYLTAWNETIAGLL